MKFKKSLALSALSLASMAVAHAEDFDNRWYFTTGLAAVHNDDGRETTSGGVLGMIGIGTYINSRASVDVFVDRTTRKFANELHGAGNFANTVLGLSARWYFMEPDSWQPYITAGVGADYHDTTAGKADVGAMFQAGIGLQKALTDNVRFRTELTYRYDFDSDTYKTYSPFIHEDHFGDWMLGVGLTVALGDAGSAPRKPDSKPATPVTPAPSDCHSKDSDHDGVNDCDDKCPGTSAGTIVGPDGCPQKVVIDLRGVNFKFDRPKAGEKDIGPSLKEPTSESLSILDQAVDTLKRYPNIHVEVDGHTDSVGTDAYNQKLSERRAKIVYDYLTSHGVSASRLDGPKGFGESKPIDTNDTKEGRQRNRRTELQVENQ